MNNSNEVQFNVEGLGVFTAYKEEPAKTFFMDRRNELAKLCGGKSELAKMESTVRLFADSIDPLEKETASQLAWELGRARAMLDMKTLFKETPKGFHLESLDVTQFDKLWIALEGARKPFPTPDKTATAEDSKVA